MIDTISDVNDDQIIQVFIREEILTNPPTMGSSSFTIDDSSMISTSASLTWSPNKQLSW